MCTHVGKHANIVSRMGNANIINIDMKDFVNRKDCLVRALEIALLRSYFHFSLASGCFWGPSARPTHQIPTLSFTQHHVMGTAHNWQVNCITLNGNWASFLPWNRRDFSVYSS